jgi:hypothetical protein
MEVPKQLKGFPFLTLSYFVFLRNGHSPVGFVPMKVNLNRDGQKRIKEGM